MVNSAETKKSLNAGIVGVVLVALVFLATFLRSGFFKKSDLAKKESLETELFQEEAADDLAIAPSSLFQKIAAREVSIIDIRQSDDFLAEHILDSKNIPRDGLLDTLSNLDKTKSYVLVDDGGDFSARDAAEEIRRKNIIPKIYYLSGGFLAWKNSYGSTISFGDPLSITDQAKVTYISSEELKKTLDSSDVDGLFILDVRKNEDFLGGHLKNAENIFLEDLERKRKNIPLGKKIVVCDNDGLWAYMAAVRLFDMGIKNVLTLSDGLDAWKEKGYEVVK